MAAIRYRLNLDSVIVVTPDDIHTIAAKAANFDALVAALKAEEWDKVPGLLTVEETLGTWSEGEFKAEGGTVTHQGEAVPEPVAERIIGSLAEGGDPAAMLKFTERLRRNPDSNSVNQLFAFMKHLGIPVRPNGKILAYKGVKTNFRDCYTGNIDNSPGKLVQMDRKLIDPDPASACGKGLHVGALAYAGTFGDGGQVVICEVDPEHVVSVPNDHSCQKMRVCEYRVIGVHNGGLLPNITTDIEDAPLPKDVVTTTRGDEEPEVDAAAIIADLPAGTTTDGKTAEGEAAPAEEGAGTVLPLTGTDWDDLNDMDSLELAKLRIMRLRAYARFNCLIIGASKMRGGKEVLVPAICKARGYADPAERG